MKKLKGGCYEARLVLAPDVVAFAETQWQKLGHLSVEDYLNAVLNTALFHEEVSTDEEADKVQPITADDGDAEPVF